MFALSAWSTHHCSRFTRNTANPARQTPVSRLSCLVSDAATLGHYSPPPRWVGRERHCRLYATTRRTVSLLLKRFTSEDLAALRPRSRRPRHRVRKVTVAIIQRIRSLQHNHRLGAWRMAAALKQEGIRISPRTCGLIMAKNKTLYAELRPPDPPPAADPKPMPFAAIRPHQFWSIDIRYLDMHQLGGGNIYCLTILDNYSRAVIASCVSRSQDLTMYLLVLFAAIRNHGAPEAIVTDGGSIFRANQAQNIYRALGITKHQIAKKQPWQNYIETTFNIQRRMTDVSFETATTWEALLDAHAVWVANYNYQDHCASPAECSVSKPGRGLALDSGPPLCRCRFTVCVL